MNPTLYAEDITGRYMWHRALSDDEIAAMHNTIMASNKLACLLPRRCENCWGNPGDCMECVLRHCHDACTPGDCPMCGGRGWLYPDKPDWWVNLSHLPEWQDQFETYTWHDFCETVWRVLGIVEEPSGN